jgi:pseudouridine-5'-phosphate glycosidase
MIAAVRAAAAEPAFTAVLHGQPVAGLTDDELSLFLDGNPVAKASSRDLAGAVAAGTSAATTVAGSLVLCRLAGLNVLATGGIGGVHRGAPLDESADLLELSRTPVVVVCAGAKSILDLPATVERLESLGVGVVGYRTRDFPGFHYGSTGLPVPHVVDDPESVAACWQAQRGLDHPAAVVVVQPPPPDAALERRFVESAVDEALAEAREAGIAGPATTPFLLGAVARRTGNRALACNLAVLEANARLAGEVAARLERRDS